MTREEKIAKIANITKCAGFVYIEEGIETSKGYGDTINVFGISYYDCGDEIIVGCWDSFTDNDIEIIYGKMLNYCGQILSLAR